MPNQVPRCAKIWADSTQKLTWKFMVFDVGQDVNSQKVRIPAAAQAPPAHPTHQGGCPMSSASSFNDPAGRELLAMLRNARRNKFGDPKYHSGRK